MTFLWTRSTRLGGKFAFISYFLKEPCGHFAIRFSNGMIVHWSFSGFKLDSLMAFLEKREVVFTMDHNISKYREEKFYDMVTVKYKESGYDYGYLSWLIYRGFLLTIFKRPIPYTAPAFDSSNNMLCNEALEAMPKDIRPKYDPDKANTPYRLYLELKKGEKNVVS